MFSSRWPIKFLPPNRAKWFSCPGHDPPPPGDKRFCSMHGATSNRASNSIPSLRRLTTARIVVRGNLFIISGGIIVCPNISWPCLNDCWACSRNGRPPACSFQTKPRCFGPALPGHPGARRQQFDNNRGMRPYQRLLSQNAAIGIP